MDRLVDTLRLYAAGTAAVGGQLLRDTMQGGLAMRLAEEQEDGAGGSSGCSRSSSLAIVTGAQPGGIGWHCVRRLAARGYPVVAAALPGSHAHQAVQEQGQSEAVRLSTSHCLGLCLSLSRSPMSLSLASLSHTPAVLITKGSY